MKWLSSCLGCDADFAYIWQRLPELILSALWRRLLVASDYKWPSPASGAIESKSTYLEKVDDLIIGAGIYK